MTLPLAFDTAAVWQTIVRGFLIAMALAVVALATAAVHGQVAAAAQLSLVLLILLFFAHRARGFPMGAAGAISATEVTTHPVKVFGIRLATPVGRFPVSAFRSIVVDERMLMNTTSGDPRIGDVYLAGEAATPLIRVFSGKRDAARVFAQDLSRLMGIERIETR